jgi:phenylacetate-coenzyme A ligase PaaK-like adenylate-forming protein
MKNKKFLISFDVEYIPDELDNTIEEALEHMFDEIWSDIGSYHNLIIQDVTNQEIKIGSILTLSDTRKLKVIDNSDLSKEYPVALLDIHNNKILITTYSMEYMKKYKYVYLDNKEIEIEKVENFEV